MSTSSVAHAPNAPLGADPCPHNYWGSGTHQAETHRSGLPRPCRILAIGLVDDIDMFPEHVEIASGLRQVGAALTRPR